MDTGNNGQMLQHERRGDRRGEGPDARATRPSTAGRAACRSPPSPRAARTSSAARSTTSRRDSDWNANSWVNSKNGDAEAETRQQDDWGYTHRRAGRQARRHQQAVLLLQPRVPAADGGGNDGNPLPRARRRSSAQGDFSQTRDNTGALFNLIRDPRSTAAVQRGEHRRLLPGRRRPRHASRRTGCMRRASAILQPLSAAERQPGTRRRTTTTKSTAPTSTTT